MTALIRQVLMSGPAFGFSKQPLAIHRESCSFKDLVIKRLLSMCLVALGLSCSLSNVAGQRQINAVALVPPTAVAVAKINWSVVSHDSRFRSMLNADQLDRALAQLKIDGSSVSEIVIFSGINSTPTGVVAGIFRGSFNLPDVKTALETQGSSEQKYMGQTIYCNQADRSCATFFRSGLLVVGSQKAVEGVIQVALNPRQGLTSRPPFNSLLRRFVAGGQPISFAMALPLEYQMVAEVGVKVVSALFSFSGLGPLGFVIDKIGFPQAIGFAITRNANTFPTELVAKMKDESSAALVSGTFNLAQSINLGMLSNQMPQADSTVLKNMSVTRKGPLLSINMILREQDLPPPRR
jgi:hypothetical protein